MINNQTTFGIEIETQIPTNIAIRVGYHGNGLPVTEVTLSNGQVVQAPRFAGEAWKADEDPSIRTANGFKKCEFVSPVLKGDQGLQHILEFLTFLKAIGAKRPIRMGGATQGGIHVTIHAGTSCGSSSPAQILNWCEKVARLGFKLSPVLYGQNAERRDLSQWCPLHPSRTLDAEIKRAKDYGTLNINIGKYALINFSKLRSTGCIEFRGFSTTLNPNKIMLIISSVFLICQEANRANIPNWSSSRRIERTLASELFRTIWAWRSRRDITNFFPTLKRFSRSMFNWGYASCAWFDRLKNGSLPVASERGHCYIAVDQAVELMSTPLWQSHVRGSI
jgi:hypothetical protein